MTEFEAREQIRVLEVEINELQVKSITMSQRIGDAQTAQRNARDKIIEGDSKAARAATEAAEVIASLTPELQKLSDEILSRQSRIAIFQRAIAQNIEYSNLAAIALRSADAKQELESAFAEICTAFRSGLVKMHKSRDEILAVKKEFLEALRCHFPDFEVRRANKDSVLRDELASLMRELRQRGAEVDPMSSWQEFDQAHWRDEVIGGYSLITDYKKFNDAHSLESIVRSAFMNRHTRVD